MICEFCGAEYDEKIFDECPYCGTIENAVAFGALGGIDGFNLWGI